MGVFGIEDDEPGEFSDAVRGRKIHGSNTEQAMNDGAQSSNKVYIVRQHFVIIDPLV